MPFTASQAALWCSGQLDGPDQTFSGLEALDQAQAGEMTFAGTVPYARKLAKSAASGAIVTRALPIERRPDQTILWVPNADLAVAQVLEQIAPPLPLPPVGVHPTALIDPTAQLGADVRIGPYVVVQAGAQIGAGCVLMAQVFVGAQTVLGDNCLLWPNVCVRERCKLGHRVILHPGVVIGSDGFGYRFAGGKHVKIPQIGTVEIGDDCELGANTTIDRGKFSATVIGAGSKLDNQVQIGHNVRLGRHSVLVAHTAIGGSTRTGDYLVMGGMSAIADHVQVGTAVQLAAMSALAAETPDGAKMAGIPAVPARQAFADIKSRRQLPQALETLRTLEQRIATLESAAKDHRP
ncbi:MAG: UDP-3-O-(3-hydroxymyristoyl)glucosamine N-acyltransferase [Phycisphaerae bacterium]